jgi:hypothetical protein
MKTKLLKKFRKNFSITYYPAGHVDRWGELHDTPILVSRQIDWKGVKRAFMTEVPGYDHPETKEAYQDHLDTIIYWLKKDYMYLKAKKSELKSKQLWYESKSNKQVGTQAA